MLAKESMWLLPIWAAPTNPEGIYRLFFRPSWLCSTAPDKKRLSSTASHPNNLVWSKILPHSLEIQAHYNRHNALFFKEDLYSSSENQVSPNLLTNNLYVSALDLFIVANKKRQFSYVHPWTLAYSRGNFAINFCQM